MKIINAGIISHMFGEVNITVKLAEFDVRF